MWRTIPRRDAHAVSLLDRRMVMGAALEARRRALRVRPNSTRGTVRTYVAPGGNTYMWIGGAEAARAWAEGISAEGEETGES